MVSMKGTGKAVLNGDQMISPARIRHAAQLLRVLNHVTPAPQDETDRVSHELEDLADWLERQPHDLNPSQ